MLDPVPGYRLLLVVMMRKRKRKKGNRKRIQSKTPRGKGGEVDRGV